MPAPILNRMDNPVRGLLHGSAAMAALIGLALLVHRARGHGAAVAGGAIFGAALAMMYAVSSLYHSVPWGRRWKVRLQRVDHSMIYLVVAGTFTPIAIASLRGGALVAGLGVVWLIATVGIGIKMWLPDVATWLSVTLQLAMGWSALIWLPQIHEALGTGAIALIGLGGVCYTVGVVMFLTRRPRLRPPVFSYHELFHVLVIAASALHFMAVFNYAVPAAL